MSKQTAVEWLLERFNDGTLIPKSFEIAKAMEKEQIVDAQSYAISKADMTNNKGYFDAEQYYQETYGKAADDK